MNPRCGATLAALAAAFLLATGWMGCVRNPVTGERQLSLVSEEQELDLGKQTAEEVRQAIGISEDPELNAYVAEIGRKLAAKSERPDLPWQFQVLDDDAVNAFALPGGPVFVTRGLLAHMGSEAELAAVLGHEVGHIAAKHSVTQLSRAQLAQAGLGLGAALEPSLAKYSQLAGAGLQLLFLRFSRDHERQADELGFEYLLEAGYAPEAMVSTFETLDQVSQEGENARLPSWLSTHPDPGDRVTTARERLEEWRASADPGRGTGGAGQEVGRDEYLAAIDGMVFGPDPRKGYFRGSAFYHPELRFRMDFPAGWKTQNTAQAVGAISPQQDGVVQLALARPGQTPEAAMQDFLSRQGFQATAAAPVRIGGQPAPTSGFQAQAEEGAVRGLVAFFSHGGRTYGALGYATAEKAPAHDAAFRAALESFQPLNDPAALQVQPAILEIVTVPQEMTVEAFQSRYPSSIPLEQVATINGLQPGETLKAGQKAKRVVGGL